MRLGSRSGLAIAVVGLAAAAFPALANAYLVSIAGTAIVLSTLAISTAILTSVAGLPSLGQAAYLAAGGYTAALLATELGVTNAPAQLAAATAVAALLSAATAPLVLRARGSAYLMVTLAVAELVRTVASKWSSLTGGDDGLLTPAITLAPGVVLKSQAYVYWYLLACFLVVAALVAWLLRSRLALLLRAAADHEPRLGALGYRVPRTLLAGHVIAAAVAGAAGALMVANNRYLSPADFSLDTSAIALLAAAIGSGSMRGTVAGAVFIVAVRDFVGAWTNGHAVGLLGLAFLLIAYRPAIARRLGPAVVRRLRGAGPAVVRRLRDAGAGVCHLRDPGAAEIRERR